MDRPKVGERVRLTSVWCNDDPDMSTGKKTEFWARVTRHCGSEYSSGFCAIPEGHKEEWHYNIYDLVDYVSAVEAEEAKVAEEVAVLGKWVKDAVAPEVEEVEDEVEEVEDEVEEVEDEVEDEVAVGNPGRVLTDPATNPKASHGAAKAPFFGIPWSAVVWLANVMRGGANKYGFFNYRETKIAASTYHDAIIRHFLLWADGEDIDKESGCPHLAHVMACCALYLDAEGLGMVTDDRNKTGRMADILTLSAGIAREYEEKLKAEGKHLYV